MLQPDATYQLLRNLTSPVVAITAERKGKENGMISDAAVRASIVPAVPRLSVYIHKFTSIPHHTGKTGVPVLNECFAHFECRVANVMDTGSSTLFLGDVVAVGRGAAAGLEPRGELLTATYFRTNMPAEWRAEYEAKLKDAQQLAAEMSRTITPVVWRLT